MGRFEPLPTSAMMFWQFAAAGEKIKNRKSAVQTDILCPDSLIRVTLHCLKWAWIESCPWGRKAAISIFGLFAY